MNCEHCFRSVPSEKVGDKLWCKGCVPDTKYITYPESREYHPWGALYRVKPEYIPASPPWTTWNGILQCEESSRIGQWLKDMDPHVKPGFTMIKGQRHELPGMIRGLWTASKSPIEYCIKLN
jgi:hypothetical protein